MKLESKVKYYNGEICLIDLTCDKEWIYLSLYPEKIDETEKKLQKQIENDDHEKEETERQVNSLWNIVHLTEQAVLRCLRKEFRDKYLDVWQGTKGFILSDYNKTELDYWINKIICQDIKWIV